MATTVGPRRTKRATRRLAQVRMANPKALQRVDPSDGYTPREARKVAKKYTRMKARGKFAPPKAPAKPPKKPPGFDPLAPVTAANSGQEIRAQTRLEFGEREDALRGSAGRQAQTTANTGTYYDDYRKALSEATARINATNAASVEAGEKRVDTAYTQDSEATAKRDAEASEQAAKLGRGPVVTAEGSRAVEAQRSQGNADVQRTRDQAGADNLLMEQRGSTSVLAKGQALARENAKAAAIDKEGVSLAKDKGAFKVAARGKLRESEREWSAIQKEFGLDKQKLKIDAKAGSADRKVALQKANTQKIVARIYASADNAGARAQIRVAKLQLEKGKIDQKQYRHIVNEYKGLPKKGKSPAAKGTTGPGGKGSGPGGSLAPWERDKVDIAVRSLDSAKATESEKAKMIDLLVKRGQIPARLARIAWKRYLKANPTTGTPGATPGPPTPS